MDNATVVHVSGEKDALPCDRRLLKEESIRIAVIQLSKARSKNAIFDEENL